MSGRADSGRIRLIIVVAVTMTPAHSAEGARIATFPSGFLFGVSTSGFQAEGSFPDSNWTGYARGKTPYGDSVDFRHRYPGDIELARGLGLNVFRTSLEWARIEPRRGVRDESVIANGGGPSGYVPVRRPAWCSVEDLIATCLGRTPPYRALYRGSRRGRITSGRTE